MFGSGSVIDSSPLWAASVSPASVSSADSVVATSLHHRAECLGVSSEHPQRSMLMIRLIRCASTPPGGRSLTGSLCQSPGSFQSLQMSALKPGQIRCQERMALGNPLSRLQQAFARLLARFHKKSLCFRSSFVGAWFDAAGAVAYSVVCNRPEHRCYQVFPVR